MNPELLKKVKERAYQFTNDNLINFGEREVLLVENAMLVGISIAIEDIQMGLLNLEKPISSIGLK